VSHVPFWEGPEDVPELISVQQSDSPPSANKDGLSGNGNKY
jgi:hypothetical protein